MLFHFQCVCVCVCVEQRELHVLVYPVKMGSNISLVLCPKQLKKVKIMKDTTQMFQRYVE